MSNKSKERIREMRDTLVEFTRRKYIGTRGRELTLEREIREWENMEPDKVVAWFDLFFQTIEHEDPFTVGDWITVQDVAPVFAIRKTSPEALQVAPLEVGRLFEDILRDVETRFLWIPRSIIHYNRLDVSSAVITHRISIPLWFINLTLKAWINATIKNNS